MGGKEEKWVCYFEHIRRGAFYSALCLQPTLAYTCSTPSVVPVHVLYMYSTCIIAVMQGCFTTGVLPYCPEAA